MRHVTVGEQIWWGTFKQHWGQLEHQSDQATPMGWEGRTIWNTFGA